MVDSCSFVHFWLLISCYNTWVPKLLRDGEKCVFFGCHSWKQLSIVNIFHGRTSTPQSLTSALVLLPQKAVLPKCLWSSYYGSRDSQFQGLGSALSPRPPVLPQFIPASCLPCSVCCGLRQTNEKALRENVPEKIANGGGGGGLPNWSWHFLTQR